MAIVCPTQCVGLISRTPPVQQFAGGTVNPDLPVNWHTVTKW
jgi:hypothetical protein